MNWQDLLAFFQKCLWTFIVWTCLDCRQLGGQIWNMCTFCINSPSRHKEFGCVVWKQCIFKMLQYNLHTANCVFLRAYCSFYRRIKLSRCIGITIRQQFIINSVGNHSCVVQRGIIISAWSRFISIFCNQLKRCKKVISKWIPTNCEHIHSSSKGTNLMIQPISK